MKRQRLPLLLTSAIILVVFAVTGYTWYLSSKSQALMAKREPGQAIERYAQIREALATEEARTASEEVPVGNEEQDLDTSPQADSEMDQVLQNLAQAQETLDKVQLIKDSDPAWKTDIYDLITRPSSTWTEAEWQQVREFIARNSDLLDEIRLLAAGEGPLYPLDFSEGYALLLPHLAPLRSMTRLLHASSVARAQAGDLQGAVEDIVAGVRLASRLEEEPLLISQLVRTAMDNIMLSAVVSAFPEGEVPPALVTALRQEFPGAALPSIIAETLRMEESMGLDWITGFMSSGWDAGREQLRDTFPHGEFPGNEWGATLYASPFARPWQHLDMHTFNHYMDRFTETMSMPYYEALPIVEDIEADIADLPITRVFTRGITPGLLNVHRVIAREQTMQQLFFLGVAVEAYASEHGTYPPSLEAVSGLGGTSVIDPHTGEPFRYEVSGNGFELYSVGPNRTDDGARHHPVDGDIVWRGRIEDAPQRKTALVASR